MQSQYRKYWKSHEESKHMTIEITHGIKEKENKILHLSKKYDVP